MNPSKDKTLLFAEDELELLEIYNQWFNVLGYRVLLARNGREALTFCRTEQVDLVISDVRMAGGDGIELARQLHATLDTTPPLVFLTGFTDISNEEAYYDLGACAILSKPISREGLRKAVERFLKSPRALWAQPPVCQPKVLVGKDYRSFESAVEGRELSMGRGGMFVRDCDLLPDNIPLGFQMRFAEGKVVQLQGSGILRWQRILPRQEHPAGVGIEILHLAAPSLDPVVQWISQANPRAFIPRH